MSQSTYSRFTRVLHWTSAAMIVLLLVSGVLMQQMTAGAPRLLGYRAHAIVGALTGLFTLVRIGWGLKATAPDALPMSKGHALAFRAVHVAMLAAALVLVVSGIAMVAGSPVLDLITGDVPPTVFPDLFSMPPRIGHRVAAISFVVLLVGHVGGVIRYQLTEGETFARMGIDISKNRTQL